MPMMRTIFYLVKMSKTIQSRDSSDSDEIIDIHQYVSQNRRIRFIHLSEYSRTFNRVAFKPMCIDVVLLISSRTYLWRIMR